MSLGLYSSDQSVFPTITSDINVTQYGWTDTEVSGVTLIMDYLKYAQNLYNQTVDLEASIKLLIDQVGTLDGMYNEILTMYNDFLLKYPKLQETLDTVNQQVIHIEGLSTSVQNNLDEVIRLHAEVAQMKVSIDASYLQIQSMLTDVTTKAAQVSADSATVTSNLTEVNRLYTECQNLVDELRKGQIYRGTWNPNSGAWPAHLGTNSVWDVVLNSGQTEVTWNGIKWIWGDRLLYILSSTSYQQIESGVGVLSVNGKAGFVILSAEDVGAPSRVEYKNVTYETLRRSYAEAGYNLVDGSFEQGGTLVNINDVLLYEASGKAYSGRAGVVAAGTNPASGGFADESGVLSVIAITDIAALRAKEPLFNGQRQSIIGYYTDTPLQGGGDFIYDSTDTTTPDDGVLTFVTAGGKRWKRKNSNHLGKLSALYAGARADSKANLDAMTNLSSGTDNSAAQIRADNAAALLGCRVHWPDGKYRFTHPLQRKVIHEGNFTYAAGGTTFILDNASATTWLLPIPGRGDNRSQDVYGIWFVAAQLHVHRLFSAGFYRGSVDNCRVSRFDTGFDVDGVYVWFKKVYFDNNNKGVYPRALGGTVGAGDASTMFGFEDCVFFMNADVGFLHEVRPEGVDAAAKELLNVQFIRCGFEYNQRGLVMTGRCWYVGLLNCWSEGNSIIGVSITNSFTDVYEMGCRWDDTTPPVFPQNRHFRWGPDGLMVNATRKTNYRNVNNVIENKSSSFIVKQDGTILNNSGLPVTASIAVDNTLTLTFNGDLNQPLVTVTPVIRNQYLSYSLAFDNTGGAPLPGDSNRVNLVRVRCFEPATPAIIVKPLWWNVTVAWPSNSNT